MSCYKSKGIFYLPIFKDKFDSYNLQIIKNTLLQEYKNIAYFTPVNHDNKDGYNSCLDIKEFKDHLLKGEEKLVRKIIINKFEELLKYNDFVIVLGIKFSWFEKFDISTIIAKDLNIPLIVDYQDNKFAKFHNNICKKYSVENLGYIENKIINFTSGDTVNINNLNKEIILNNINNCKNNITTPVRFEYDLFKRAKQNLKTIVLPEGNEDRILKAASILSQSNSVNLILLGKEKDIKKREKELNLNLLNIKIIDNENNENLDEFANCLYELRKDKGINLEKARIIVKDRNYFATMLVYKGLADGVVSGADGTTADTIRPALQIIKTKPGIDCVSGLFFVCLDTKVKLFADCAVVPNPTPKNLASFAISSIQTAKSFGIKPKVAMLSYSTGDSGSGKSVDEIKEAVRLANELAPNELIDGPMQFDAAVDKTVALKKMPNSKVAGNANIFIFPDLNSGNIAYKAVRRTANAVAIGPLLQGLKKPINDLSRGCNVEDIVNTVLMSAIQAGEI